MPELKGDDIFRNYCGGRERTMMNIKSVNISNKLNPFQSIQQKGRFGRYGFVVRVSAGFQLHLNPYLPMVHCLNVLPLQR